VIVKARKCLKEMFQHLKKKSSCYALSEKRLSVDDGMVENYWSVLFHWSIIDAMNCMKNAVCQLIKEC